MLAGKIQLIAVAHIEVGAGDGAASAGRGLGDFIFKIDLHGALAVLAFTAVPLAVHKVAAIAIHFSHRRLQVVHIAFHLAVFRIFGAVFTSTLMPALTLMAELPCRHYVLPFNPAGAVLIFTHFIAAGFQIDNAFFPLPVDFTAAIKIARNVGIHFDASGFGLGKTINTSGRKRTTDCRAQYRYG